MNSNYNTTMNNKEIRFRKIRYKESQVSLEYEMLNRNGDWDEYSFRSRQDPHPDFCRALDMLAAVQVIICELLDGSYSYDMITPDDVLSDGETLRHDATGISLSYSGEAEDVMGVTIISKRKVLSSRSMNIVSPHLFADKHSDGGDEDALLSPECLVCVKNLIKEAEEYLFGKRKQMELFSEEVNTETGEVLA